MATMAELRAALATSIEPLSNVQVSPYMLANPTPPAADVEPAPIDYDLAMKRGLDKWTFIVRVYVGLSGDIAAQKKLDAYIEPTGATSIKTLVEADRTLGGLCDSVQVIKCSGYRTFERAHGASPLLLGAEWTVVVHASN